MYTSAFPAVSHADWNKSAAIVRNLDKLRERIKTLEAARSREPLTRITQRITSRTALQASIKTVKNRHPTRKPLVSFLASGFRSQHPRCERRREQKRL